MKKSLALFVFVVGILSLGFVETVSAQRPEYTDAQCLAINPGISKVTTEVDCYNVPGNLERVGEFVAADCTWRGSCCAVSAPNPPTYCRPAPCENTSGGVCGLLKPSGSYVPGIGYCASGSCWLPSNGRTCQDKGGVCVRGTCQKQGRLPAALLGNCIGVDSGSTCCTDETFQLCAGTCRSLSSCGTLEKEDASSICQDVNKVCCVSNIGAPGVVNTTPYQPYQLLELIPGSSNKMGSLKTYLQDIYKFAFWAVGVAVVFMLTVGGFMYLTSAGNTSRMETAKTVILDAFLGLALALVAWLFLYVINPDLVNVKLPSVGITAVTPAVTPATSSTVKTLAQQIQTSSNIELQTSGSCRSAQAAVSPALTIRQSAQDEPVIACKFGCPGTGLCTATTTLNESLLRGLWEVAASFPLTVTSITGGSHGGSSHYVGRAVDVVPKAPLQKSQWPQVVSLFKAKGAPVVICDITDSSGKTIIVPCDDARADHIHAEW